MSITQTENKNFTASNFPSPEHFQQKINIFSYSHEGVNHCFYKFTCSSKSVSLDVIMINDVF